MSSYMSVAASQIEEVVVDKGIPAMAEAYAAQPIVYPQIAEVVDNMAASTPYKGDISTTLLGLARPMEIEHGQDIPASSLEMGYTPQGKIRKFARSITFTREDIAAAQGNVRNMVMRQLSDLGPQWAEVFAAQKDDLIADMFVKGPLTAGDTDAFKNGYDGRAATDGFIYDGLPFFDGAHPQSPIATGTTYSNHTASLSLTATNLQTVVTAVKSTNAKNGRGERILNTPNTLLVGPAQEYTARTVLESTLLPGSAQNDINVMAGSLNLVVHPAITGDGWFVGRAGAGLRAIDSGIPEFRVTANDDNDTVTLAATTYFGAYVRDWRPWYCANLAAS